MRRPIAFLEVAVGVLMGAVTVVVSLQVLSRFLLNTPMDWTEEVSRISFGFLTLLGAAAAFAIGRQLHVDVLIGALSGSKQHALRLFSDLVSIGFWSAVLVLSWPLLQSVHVMSTPVMRLPSSLPYAAIPIGALLIVVILARDAALQVRSLLRARAGDG